MKNNNVATHACDKKAHLKKVAQIYYIYLINKQQFHLKTYFFFYI